MNTLFGVDAGELPQWMSAWTQRLLEKGQLDTALPELLEEIGGLARADRSLVFLKNGNSEGFEIASEWCVPGFEKIGEKIPVLSLRNFPVLGSRILKSKSVILSGLDELPEEAATDRAMLSSLGIDSVLALPISADGKVVGFLALQADRTGREWDPATVTLLSAIGGIISIALDQHEIVLEENRLHRFLEAAADFTGIADPESLELLYLNPAGRELIGLPANAPLKGVTVDRITPDSDMMFKKDVVYPMLHEKGSWRGEMTIRTLDSNEEIPVDQMMVKIPLPDHPSKYGIGSVIHDLRGRKAAEKKLIESERLLRDLIAAAPHALYLLNYESRRMEIGERNFAQMTGYSTEELRNLEGGVYGPVHPDDVPAVEAQEAALAKASNEKVVPVMFRYRRKDGNWDWLEVHSKVFERDENGKPLSEVGMAQIVTGRKVAEERMRRIEDRIDKAVRGARVGLWDSDLTTGKDWWSSRIYELLGFEAGEIEPTYENYVALLHPDDRQLVRDCLDSHLADGTIYDVEFRMRRKSGNYRWFRVRGEAIPDENGIPVRMAGSIEDIDGRKQTELKLHREAEINRVVFHVTDGFAFVLDADGKTIRSNRAASDLTEYTESEFREKPLWDLLFPAASRQRAEALDEIEQIRNGARFFQSMRKIWRKSGSTRTVEYACTGIYAKDSSLINIVVVGFDLSEHQRLHREVIRMVEQEQIRIGADLHDGVGQLMTGVSDLSEALTQRLRDPGDRAAAGEIYLQVRNAISEIRRMSHGMTPTSIERHGLAGSLKVLAESVEDQSRIRCSVSIEQLDEVRDVEVVTNLFRIAQEAINNAVKHSEADAIAISLKETEKETILTIDDNGIGIEAKEKTVRHGVGLTVMEYRVGLMGGTLEIRNRPTGGTRVRCRLLVDFDRLDRLKSGRVLLYKPKLKKLIEAKPVEPVIEIVDR